MASIVDDKIWKTEWVDCSAKNDPPPDFYSESQKLMMEVMRIDDHAFEQNGKVINPTIQRESMRAKELRKKLNLSSDTQLFINSPTDLPSLQDHNYRFYKYNFKRVIEKHIEKIPLYRSNHPDYKLIFFVFDESSMYCQTDIQNRIIKKDEPVLGKPHVWYFDKAFIDVFMNSGIDYLIWFTPYKCDPLCAILQKKLGLYSLLACNQIVITPIDYPEDYMMSLVE